MSHFNKLSIVLLLVFILFSLSAFSFQTNQNLHTLLSSKSIQAADNQTPTVSLSISMQPTATVKNNKNAQPTKTPRPTSTPPVIPPPADPGASTVMIGLAIMAVSVILFGFWLNRRRIF